MAESDTLLAHIVTKRLSRAAEDTATDALAYILNNSKTAKSAFNIFLESTISRELNDCIYFSTQKADGYSRFDLVGYDAGLSKRVIGESKFDAALGTGQGGDYLQRLAEGPSVLLFIVPDYRIKGLWEEVIKGVQNWEVPNSLGDTTTKCQVRLAEDEKGRCLMMVSWRQLLDIIEEQVGNNEEAIKSDIFQLRGLTELMDREAFQPLEAGELRDDVPRRLLNLAGLIDDVVYPDGVPQSWLSVSGFQAAATYDGYYRYFKLKDSNVEAWFGLSYKRWSTREGCPLWFGLQSSRYNNQIPPEEMARVRAALHREWHPGSDGSIPIKLDTGADYAGELLPNIVSQLERIAQAIKEAREDKLA